jgi:predicted Fe-S protein YdhL (DUF1289 family)
MTDPVPSPCNSVCRMDADGAYCIGCFRTLEEIAGWAGFDDERRRLIWSELHRRKAAAARPESSPLRRIDGVGAD